MVSADVVVGPDDATAQRLAARVRAVGAQHPHWCRGDLVPNEAGAAGYAWMAEDRELVRDRVETQFVGSPSTVAERLAALQAVAGADELLVTTTPSHALSSAGVHVDQPVVSKCQGTFDAGEASCDEHRDVAHSGRLIGEVNVPTRSVTAGTRVSASTLWGMLTASPTSNRTTAIAPTRELVRGNRRPNLDRSPSCDRGCGRSGCSLPSSQT